MRNEICRFRNLTFLHINGFCISFVLDWSSHLKHVHIQNGQIQPRDMSYICSIQTIKSLIFSCIRTTFSNNDIDLLTTLPNLSYLKFEQVTFSVEPQCKKATFKLLNTLELKVCTCSRSFLEHICAPLLEHLNYYQIYNSTEAFAFFEKRFPTLKTLNDKNL